MTTNPGLGREGRQGEEDVEDPRTAQKVEIWQAARATTAAPSSLCEISINGITYHDAAKFGVNNPTRLAIREVLDIHHDDNEAIECVVSLGCGGPKCNRGGELPEAKDGVTVREEEADVQLTKAKRRTIRHGLS